MLCNLIGHGIVFGVMAMLCNLIGHGVVCGVRAMLCNLIEVMVGAQGYDSPNSRVVPLKMVHFMLWEFYFNKCFISQRVYFGYFKHRKWYKD